jgi:hypothetical protein
MKMAVLVVDKALNLCSKLQSAADLIMKGLEQLAQLKDEKESSGLDLTDAAVEAALAASALKHANGDNFNNVITSGAAIKAWMESQNHDDILHTVRP